MDYTQNLSLAASLGAEIENLVAGFFKLVDELENSDQDCKSSYWHKLSQYMKHEEVKG